MKADASTPVYSQPAIASAALSVAPPLTKPKAKLIPTWMRFCVLSVALVALIRRTPWITRPTSGSEPRR